jgi:hypothetical protein
MASAEWSLVQQAGNSPAINLLFRFPIGAVADSKALLFYRTLSIETKLTLYSLLQLNFQELLRLADLLEFNRRVYTFEQLADEFHLTRNAMIKRCLRLKLGGFPIEITESLVHYTA